MVWFKLLLNFLLFIKFIYLINIIINPFLFVQDNVVSTEYWKSVQEKRI